MTEIGSYCWAQVYLFLRIAELRRLSQLSTSCREALLTHFVCQRLELDSVDFNELRHWKDLDQWLSRIAPSIRSLTLSPHRIDESFAWSIYRSLCSGGLLNLHECILDFDFWQPTDTPKTHFPALQYLKFAPKDHTGSDIEPIIQAPNLEALVIKPCFFDCIDTPLLAPHRNSVRSYYNVDHIITSDKCFATSTYQPFADEDWDPDAPPVSCELEIPELELSMTFNFGHSAWPIKPSKQEAFTDHIRSRWRRNEKLASLSSERWAFLNWAPKMEVFTEFIQSVVRWERLVHTLDLKDLPDWIQTVPVASTLLPDPCEVRGLAIHIEGEIPPLDDDTLSLIECVLTDRRVVSLRRVDRFRRCLAQMSKLSRLELDVDIWERVLTSGPLQTPTDCKMVWIGEQRNLPGNPSQASQWLKTIMEGRITYVVVTDTLDDIHSVLWTYLSALRIRQLRGWPIRLCVGTLKYIPRPFSDMLLELVSGQNYSDALRPLFEYLRLDEIEELIERCWDDVEEVWHAAWEEVWEAAKSVECRSIGVGSLCGSKREWFQAWYAAIVNATDREGIPIEWTDAGYYVGTLKPQSQWFEQHLVSANYDELQGWGVPRFIPAVNPSSP